MICVILCYDDNGIFLPCTEVPSYSSEVELSTLVLEQSKKIERKYSDLLGGDISILGLSSFSRTSVLLDYITWERVVKKKLNI